VRLSELFKLIWALTGMSSAISRFAGTRIAIAPFDLVAGCYPRSTFRPVRWPWIAMELCGDTLGRHPSHRDESCDRTCDERMPPEVRRSGEDQGFPKRDRAESLFDETNLATKTKRQSQATEFASRTRCRKRRARYE
jgi:hypothetical protein